MISFLVVFKIFDRCDVMNNANWSRNLETGYMEDKIFNDNFRVFVVLPNLGQNYVTNYLKWVFRRGYAK